MAISLTGYSGTGLHAYIDRMNEHSALIIPPSPSSAVKLSDLPKSTWAEATRESWRAEDWSVKPDKTTTSVKLDLETAAKRLAAENKRTAHMARLMSTIKLVHSRWPHLCSRSVEINGPKSVEGNFSGSIECVENIIHASNLHREKYSHRAYQAHVTDLVGRWDSGFETELIQWIELEEQRVLRHQHASHMEQVALRSTEPADALPDYLLEELEGIAERATQGDW